MKKVFIIDDSDAVRHRLTELVSEVKGIKMAGDTGDPVQGLKAIRNHCPDIVILDIRMPRMSGLQVLEGIRQGLCAPMVIILTNYATEPYRRRCMSAGADLFLNKATEFDKIGEILKNAVQA